jgi:hypothetical protein
MNARLESVVVPEAASDVIAFMRARMSLTFEAPPSAICRIEVASAALAAARRRQN